MSVEWFEGGDRRVHGTRSWRAGARPPRRSDRVPPPRSRTGARRSCSGRASELGYLAGGEEVPGASTRASPASPSSPMIASRESRCLGDHGDKRQLTGRRVSPNSALPRSRIALDTASHASPSVGDVIVSGMLPTLAASAPFSGRGSMRQARPQRGGRGGRRGDRLPSVELGHAPAPDPHAAQRGGLVEPERVFARAGRLS